MEYYIGRVEQPFTKFDVFLFFPLKDIIITAQDHNFVIEQQNKSAFYKIKFKNGGNSNKNV